MSEYHVGAGCFGIYAGKLNKNKTMWVGDKSDVTDECIGAVIDYMLPDAKKSLSHKTGYQYDLIGGGKVQLYVEYIPGSKENA